LTDLVKNGTGRIPCLAYKVLFLIGLARYCLEDMLLICTLLVSEKRPEIDLRDEIALLKNIFDKSTKAAIKEENYDPGDTFEIFDDVEMRICSYGDNGLTVRQERDTWIVDGDFIYVLNEERGLFKLSTGTQGKMVGKIEGFNPEFAKEEASMMLFKGKLYIRYKELAPAPFVMVDTNTLKKIEMDPALKFEPKEGDKHSLQWKSQDEETGRALTYTPLITDGQYLYVIAR
jgi:hypothetical protein